MGQGWGGTRHYEDRYSGEWHFRWDLKCKSFSRQWGRGKAECWWDVHSVWKPYNKTKQARLCYRDKQPQILSGLRRQRIISHSCCLSTVGQLRDWLVEHTPSGYQVTKRDLLNEWLMSGLWAPKFLALISSTRYHQGWLHTNSVTNKSTVQAVAGARWWGQWHRRERDEGPFPSPSPPSSSPILSFCLHLVILVQSVIPSRHCPGLLWTLRSNGMTHINTKLTWSYLPGSFPAAAVTDDHKFSR